MKRNILRCLTVVLVAFSYVVSLQAQGARSFKINEVVTSNTEGLVDEYGSRSGWIEIANTSWSTIDIRSCYLTNNRATLDKSLSVPERVKLMSLVPKGDARTSLAAQQRIVFFADGRTNLGTLHTSFKLNPYGENFIALFDGNGKTLLDSVTIPPLADNQSYARVYDAEKDAYVWLALNADEVTPGMANVGQGMTQDKIAEFKEKDPHGIAMSIMAMCVVFGCLLTLYIFFRLFGMIAAIFTRAARIKAFRSLREKAEKAAILAKQGMETKGIDMKIYMAVIGMALHEYEEDVHDVETGVLTYTPEEHTEWNAKGYGMREWHE